MSAGQWDRAARCPTCGAEERSPCVGIRNRRPLVNAHAGRPRIPVPYVPPRERGKYRALADFLSMLKRMTKAAGERVAYADMDDLRALVAIHDELEESIRVAIDGMRAAGYTWKDIGAEVFGTTGQAVYYRYGKPKAG